MQIRQEVFDTYWRFAAERQEIFFKRIHGEAAPWSIDPVLNTYKFCNAYRASDRVSQYLIRNVIYKGTSKAEEVLFRILFFKIFNTIETWEYVESALGEITFAEFDFQLYANLLEQRIQSGRSIYTSAYMSCATKAFGYDRKHMNHLALLQKMFLGDKLPQKIARTTSMTDVFGLFREYPLLGNFMSYQLTTDINYSEVVDFDENSFTIAGPGSERGIKKCFIDTGGKSKEYIIQWMQERQEKEFERLGISFKSLWGRPLQLIDCQGLFCETDKYSRVAFPDLKSNRIKIKAEFKQNTAPIIPFYPPKWGLNTKIEKDLVI